MAELQEIIERLAEKIDNYKYLYQQNEMAVRDHILNPVLKALGWNPENPEEVRPNVFTGEGVPDYTLFKNDKKVLFVEAKNLSVEVEQKKVLSQLARYCFSEGMRYGVLTNGAMWVLFRSFEEGTTVEQRTIWKVDIFEDHKTTILSRLNTITKDNIEKVDSLVNKLQILDQIWKEIIEDPTYFVKGLSQAVDTLCRERCPDEHFDQIEIEDFLQERIDNLLSPKEETLPTPKVKPTPITGTEAEKIKINRDKLFLHPGPAEKRYIKDYILGKRELWKELISKKTLLSKEIVSLGRFKAIGPFAVSLQKRGLATKIDFDKLNNCAVWRIEEEVIPHIRKILASG